MKKRIISLLLSLVMLSSLMPAAVFAESPAPSETPTPVDDAAEDDMVLLAAGSFDPSALNGIPASAHPGSGTTAWTSSGNIIQSGNKGKNYSSSTLELSFTADVMLSFQYMVSSEAKYDTFTISRNGSPVVNAVSGEIGWTDIQLELNTGDTLSFTYKKDGSGDSGEDCARLCAFSAGEPVAVTFHANGGSGEDHVQNMYGPAALKLNSFTKDHAVFEGWSTSPNGDVVYTDGQSIEKPEAALDLYAVWASACVVYFESTAVNVKVGETIDAAAVPVPSRTGYTFSGWFSGNIPLDIQEPVTEDITYSATWTPITYIIRFEANGGAGAMAEINLAYDQSINLPANAFARNGYRFTGWGNSAGSSSPAYADEGNVANLCTAQGQVCTLYALWAGEQVDITIDLNYETEGRISKRIGVVGENYNYIYNEATGKPQFSRLNDPERDGYIFAGWFDSVTGGNEVTTQTKFADASPVTMYAQWVEAVTISFNANGGSCYTSSKQIPVGTSYGYLPSASLSGKAFEGWFTSPDGGQLVDRDTTFSTDTTLYAHYRNYRYIINYHANGGQGEMEAQPCDFGVDNKLSACAFSRDGYLFRGWSTSSYYSTVKYEDKAVINREYDDWDSYDNESFNLYAVWEETVFSKALSAISAALPKDGIIRETGSLGLPASAAGCSISYVSSTSLINGDEVLKLPDRGSYPLTIKATVTDPDGNTQSRSYELLMYSAAAAEAESYLKKAAQSLTGNFSPVYGTDKNANAALEKLLVDKGYEGIRVTVKEAAGDDRASIAADGTISYYFNPAMTGRGGYFYTVFILARDGAAVEKERYTFLEWDMGKAQNQLDALADSVKLPSEPVTELSLPRYALKDGVDPDNVDYGDYNSFCTWATITWTSADENIVRPGAAPAYPYYSPFSAELIRSPENNPVELTAGFSCNSLDLTAERKYTITVKGTDADALEQLKKELEAKLDQGFESAGIKDFATGAPLDTGNVTGDIQLPSTRDFGVDGSEQPVSISSSNESIIETPGVDNAARVWVYRPLPGQSPEEVTITVSITDKATGVVASKDITVTVQPLSQTEIDAELALMERVRAAYFDGIKNANTCPDDITTDLRAFQEAYIGPDGELVWVYDYTQRSGSGIVPVSMDGWEAAEQWRLFRSSNAQVVSHETLQVTRNKEHKAVTVTSWLSSETYGKYADRYPGDARFAALCRQPVTAELIVTGTDPSSDKPEKNELTISFSLEDNGSQWYGCQLSGLEEGSTAYDALVKAMSSGGYGLIGGSFVTGVVTPDGTILREKDRGPNSGWMYSVNGAIPDAAMSQYFLSDEDHMVFFYTDDYTKLYGSTLTAGDVETLISAIGKVTVNSGGKIQTARDAYENLSDAEKAKVGNLSVLEEAERVYARLISGKAGEYLDIYITTGDFIETRELNSLDSFGCEWLILGLARAEREIPEEYFEAAEKYVEEHINAASQLSEKESTLNSRLILALTAAGKDVSHVAGHNLLQGLSDMEHIEKQGISGLVYALLALDCGDYEIPAAPAGAVQTSRQALLDSILEKQLEDGGWAFAGEKAEADISAMTVQALSSYYDSDKRVKASVDKAVAPLSSMQSSTGGYSSGKTLTSESAAQVVVALTALGIDPFTDSRFIKNDVSVLDSLCSFYVDGGGFRHSSEGKLDEIATAQGFYALCAYYRFINGSPSLYDMSDIIDRPLTEAA